MPKPCPLCGDPMHRQSKQCRACWTAQHVRPANYVTRACQKCRAPFTVHRAQTERGQAKYCSRSCARSGSPTRKKATPEVTCETCGTTFSKYRAEIRKNVGGKHFCSPECWYSHNQREEHYGWAGGQDERMNPESRLWRKAVLERDKNHCRRCHGTARLETHHIHPFGQYPEKRWEVSNGVTLCRSCHQLFRHREMEYAEILTFMAPVPVVVWR